MTFREADWVPTKKPRHDLLEVAAGKNDSVWRKTGRNETWQILVSASGVVYRRWVCWGRWVGISPIVEEEWEKAQ